MGAGAAGLMAGISAATHGAKVLVLEKNRKPGVKILMSGGTRCNITHDTDNLGIIKAYGKQGKFLHSPLATFSVENTLDFFHQSGVPTKVEETGKVFPQSNKALDVLTALVNRLHGAGAKLYLEEPVIEIHKENDLFHVKTPRQTYQGNHVLITTGGLSFPGCGTTGDGYGFAKQFGHTITKTFPALAPLNCKEPWVKDLSGITIPDVLVTAFSPDLPPLKDRGSLLFTHFGLSGPVILNVSKAITHSDTYKDCYLMLDFVPDLKIEDLAKKISDLASTDGKKLLSVALSNLVPRRLAEHLTVHIGLASDRKCVGITREERQKICTALKSCRLEINGTLGYAKAEVTSGGIPLNEVDSKTMESKCTKGLFLAGEIIDLDGPIGGYNFQAAWSTGYLAGKSMAARK